MSHIDITYRKRGNSASGHILSQDGVPDAEIIRILDVFLARWCGKRCFLEHGIPIFFGVPLSVKGRYLRCRLPAAFRRAGFEVSVECHG